MSTRISGVAATGLLLLLMAAPPTHAQQAPRLDVLVPASDSSRFAGARHRIAGNTDPANRVFINNDEVEVYASGAFVGLVQLALGDNRVAVRAVAPDGQQTERILQIHRPEPEQPLSPRSLTIDESSIFPRDTLWLKAGDVLEVRFRGSPTRRATFEVKGMTPRVPMRELSPDEAGGEVGIYAGRYVIQADDEVSQAPLIIRMRGRGFASTTARSGATTTVAPHDVPRVVEVTGRRPYLYASLGTDRLGGARLGSIPAGVHMAVDGRVGDHYRVRLGSDMEAWLHTRNATLLPPETPLPAANVGSITARGEGDQDVVSVPLPLRLPYIASHRANPSAIVVDLYGARSNTNWITHLQSAEGIEQVRWEQPGAEHYRLIIELTHPGMWGYEVGYADRSTLRIGVRRPPVLASADEPLRGMRVMVDAGHGGRATGAVGAAGTLEKDVTLDVARALAETLLARSADVVMTRDADDDVPMAQRIDHALSVRPDLFVSVHANSIGAASDASAVRGTSMYYHHREHQPLSQMIYDEMLALGLPEFGVVGSFNFSLSQFTEFPNVLVETAFISNPEEEMLLTDPYFQQQMAEAVVRGLERFVREHAVVLEADAPEASAE